MWATPISKGLLQIHLLVCAVAAGGEVVLDLIDGLEIRCEPPGDLTGSMNQLPDIITRPCSVRVQHILGPRCAIPWHKEIQDEDRLQAKPLDPLDVDILGHPLGSLVDRFY